MTGGRQAGARCLKRRPTSWEGLACRVGTRSRSECARRGVSTSLTGVLSGKSTHEQVPDEESRKIGCAAQRLAT